MSFCISVPTIHSYLDLRYARTSQLYKGLGSFNIADIAIQTKVSLHKNYALYYENHITSNLQAFEQLYIDIDTPIFPLNVKLGRFYTPFGTETNDQTNKNSISSSILRDILWTNDYFLVPRAENGIDIYYHNQGFAIDTYVINGGGQLETVNNYYSRKSFGANMRFLLKDFLDVGFSLLYNDLSKPSYFGNNNQFIIAENDYKFTLGDFSVKMAYLLATGKLNGIVKDGNGYLLEPSWEIEKNLILDVNVSAFYSNGISDFRRILALNNWLNKDFSVKYEFFQERLNQTDNWGIQTQLLLKI